MTSLFPINNKICQILFLAGLCTMATCEQPAGRYCAIQSEDRECIAFLKGQRFALKQGEQKGVGIYRLSGDTLHLQFQPHPEYKDRSQIKAGRLAQPLSSISELHLSCKTLLNKEVVIGVRINVSGQDGQVLYKATTDLDGRAVIPVPSQTFPLAVEVVYVGVKPLQVELTEAGNYDLFVELDENARSYQYLQKGEWQYLVRDWEQKTFQMGRLKEGQARADVQFDTYQKGNKGDR